MTILIQQRWRILCYWQLECGFFLFLWTLEKHWHVWKGSEFWKEKTRCRHNNASHLSRCLISALAAPLHWSSLAPTLTFAMFHPETPPMHLSDTQSYQGKGRGPTSLFPSSPGSRFGDSALSCLFSSIFRWLLPFLLLPSLPPFLSYFLPSFFPSSLPLYTHVRPHEKEADTGHSRLPVDWKWH